MEAARLNVEERPLRLASCEVSNHGSASRAPGIVPATPHQTAASPLFTNYTQEYDEMLKVDIKTECDDKDSAVVQELTTSHSCFAEDSIAGASLLVKEEGDFILKMENEFDEMMIKQELDIGPIFLQPKITPHILPPSDQVSSDSRPDNGFCDGAASTSFCTVLAGSVLKNEVEDEHCKENLGVLSSAGYAMSRRPGANGTAEKKYECVYCKHISARKSSLISHTRQHNGRILYKCGQCELSVPRLDGSKIHMCSHTGKKSYNCEQCKYSTSHLSHLKIHMRTHTGKKPYKCELCEYSASQSGNLKVHARIHTGERPHKCEYCDYSATQMSRLKVHMRIHTGERPYKCEQCEYSASVMGDLKMHTRTHTGEKPYKCVQCEYSASQISSLKVHMLRTHTGERPYKCKQCAYSASRMDNLRMHLRTHRVDRPYECHHCEYSTFHRSCLKMHLRFHMNLKSYKCRPYEFSAFQKTNLKYTYGRKTL